MRALGPLVLGLLLVAAPAANALPTPGLFGEEAREVTGRLFPEAMQTNDFVGFDEALDGLDVLLDENPHLLTYHHVGDSVGWDNAAGGHDTFPVFAVTVTNKESPVPMEQRINVLYMLSIHGNEKGGREGGLRVIEDFTKAVESGEEVGVATQDRVAMLDYMQLIFLFPNPDGWTHEEAEYRHNDAGNVGAAGVETQNYVRTNGNGLDLNRQAPTVGWSRAEGAHAALSQPETRGTIPWMKNNFSKIHFATDIHGMLYPANALINSSRPIHCVPASQAPDNPVAQPGDVCLREGNFVLTMIPAGQFNPREEVLITHLAEELKARMNGDDYFTEWNTLPGAGVWGGDYNGWGTVWDTIGYVDSGFHSDWFAQNHGLDAPGVDFEYSYNHITFDNYYPGLAQRINDYHVHTTRIIVGTFMDVAAQQTRVALDTGGARTAYVPTDVLVTNADDVTPLAGWAAENEHDDAFDIAHNTFNATINDYFQDRAPYLRDGNATGVLDALTARRLSTGALEDYDNLVVPGSAVRQLVENEAALSAIDAFVQGGGTLLLTDEALQLLPALGLLGEDKVRETQVYAGHTNWVDREHWLADGVRGLARQTYEPMPLGFVEGENAPAWSIERAAFEDAGGHMVGTLGPEAATVGELTHGEGAIVVVGSLLPTPNEGAYHPYGLASYATTYTGNQLVRNTLGWELVVDQAPRAQGDDVVLPHEEEGIEPTASEPSGELDDQTSIPGVGALVAAVLAALVASVARRD